MDQPIDNFIKRERRRKLQTQKQIREMREALPVYDLRDIRRYKLPFHEALLTELGEGGLRRTVAYLEQLFELQEKMRREAGPHSFLWHRPILMKSDVELQALCDALVRAEEAHDAGDHVAECEEMLRVGIRFAFETEDWGWLGKQLVIQSVVVATEYQVAEEKTVESASNVKVASKLELHSPMDQPIDKFIKRERRRKLQTQKQIREMREALPVYDLRDIRRYKLPFHEALLTELGEGGLRRTVAYLEQLFELQEKMRREAGPHSFLWHRPILMKSDVELQALCDALVKAEEAHDAGDHVAECEEMLRVGIRFAFETEDWGWLGKQLVIQSVVVATEYQVAEGKHEAISRYIYGKYLMEKSREYDAAATELDIARDLSLGRNWSLKSFLPDHKDTLFMNANYLLYVCAIRDARITMKTDHEQAAKKAMTAKKRATEACYHDGETEALLLKGNCELNMNETKVAISSFNKAYYIQAKKDSPVGMCEARVQLSKAYLIHGNTKLALQNLLLLKEKAEKSNLPFYLAQAYRYLGEYYLNNGDPRKATPLLEDALKIFIELGSIVESEQVRNLGAVSAGLELLPSYVDLILKTDRSRPDSFENLMKLVQWKDSRAPFCDEMERLSSEAFSGEASSKSFSGEILKASASAKEKMEDGKMSGTAADLMMKAKESDKEVVELHMNLAIGESEETLRDGIDQDMI